MPYIKDSFSILAECAAIDLPDTKRVVRESEVRVGYESIAEASSDYRFTAEMVPVVELDGKYYTEAQCLAPFMRDFGIRSMMEALDAVAAANNLYAKSVGLLIESACKVNEMIEKACQKESTKQKDAVMDKFGKVIDFATTLKENGYPVMRKSDSFNEADMKTAADYHKRKEEEKKKADDERNKHMDRDHKLAHGKDGDKWLSSVYRQSSNQDKKHDIEANHKNSEYAADATMRHDRRHGVKEEVEDLFNF